MKEFLKRIPEFLKVFCKMMVTAAQPGIPTPQKTLVRAINEGLKDKRLGEYLNAWVPQVHGALRCEMALLTIQYDPNRIRKAEEAWGEVSKLEKKVVDIMGMEEDILYVVSTVEMHSGRKKKGKGKEEKKETEVREEVLSVKTKEDVKGVFKKYNEKLEYEPGEGYLPRLYNFLKKIEGEGKEVEMVRELAKLEHMQEWNEATDAIYKVAIGLLNGRKVKSGGENEEATLTGYPHIHMAIAFTTTTGEIRDLRTVAQRVLEYAHDVDIRKKDGTSTKARRGRKVDIENDAKIIGYVMKNARHEETGKKLERMPTTLYNFRNNRMVTELYTMLYNNTAVMMAMDVSAREKVEIKVPFVLEILNPEPENKQTNLGPTVTNKPITKKKKTQMMNIVKTYLEKNQMAITPRGTIYQRIKESKKSWKYWGMSQELYEEMCDPENFELLDSTRQQFFTYTTGKFKKLLPYVDLDYQWIEFKDFMYNLTTSEIIKENIERQPYESFAYIPETEYGDIYPEIRKKPERWFEILRNSGYMEGDRLTDKGIELIRGVNDIYKPKTHKSKSLVLHGESNSGKTSLIDPIYNLYPRDARMKITAAGGFELAGLVMRPQFVVSDEHDKGRLRRDQTLILVEGDVEMALNIKHKNTETVNVEARSAFICNEIEWAMKEGSKKESLLTIIDAETGKEINVIREIDKAYENRMLFCKMNALPEGKCSSVMRREMIEEEKGLIPLYVGKMIHGENAFRIRK